MDHFTLIENLTINIPAGTLWAMAVSGWMAALLSKPAVTKETKTPTSPKPPADRP